jgi:hypothetical protein
VTTANAEQPRRDDQRWGHFKEEHYPNVILQHADYTVLE